MPNLRFRLRRRVRRVASLLCCVRGEIDNRLSDSHLDPNQANRNRLCEERQTSPTDLPVLLSYRVSGEWNSYEGETMPSGEITDTAGDSNKFEVQEEAARGSGRQVIEVICEVHLSPEPQEAEQVLVNGDCEGTQSQSTTDTDKDIEDGRKDNDDENEEEVKTDMQEETVSESENVDESTTTEEEVKDEVTDQLKSELAGAVTDYDGTDRAAVRESIHVIMCRPMVQVQMDTALTEDYDNDDEGDTTETQGRASPQTDDCPTTLDTSKHIISLPEDEQVIEEKNQQRKEEDMTDSSPEKRDTLQIRTAEPDTAEHSKTQVSEESEVAAAATGYTRDQDIQDAMILQQVLRCALQSVVSQLSTVDQQDTSSFSRQQNFSMLPIDDCELLISVSEREDVSREDKIAICKMVESRRAIEHSQSQVSEETEATAAAIGYTRDQDIQDAMILRQISDGGNYDISDEDQCTLQSIMSKLSIVAQQKDTSSSLSSVVPERESMFTEIEDPEILQRILDNEHDTTDEERRALESAIDNLRSGNYHTDYRPRPPPPPNRLKLSHGERELLISLSAREDISSDAIQRIVDALTINLDN